MEFKFNESTLWEDENNPERETNSYVIVSRTATDKDSMMEKIIQIIDESGKEVTCTYDKFIEIIDTKGLSGFIM